MLVIDRVRGKGGEGGKEAGVGGGRGEAVGEKEWTEMEFL